MTWRIQKKNPQPSTGSSAPRLPMLLDWIPLANWLSGITCLVFLNQVHTKPLVPNSLNFDNVEYKNDHVSKNRNRKNRMIDFVFVLENCDFFRREKCMDIFMSIFYVFWVQYRSYLKNEKSQKSENYFFISFRTFRNFSE